MAKSLPHSENMAVIMSLLRRAIIQYKSKEWMKKGKKKRLVIRLRSTVFAQLH